MPIFDSQGISAFPGMLPSQIPVAIPNLIFERACVLFNVAAMYASLGAAESRTDAEGIKRALAYFQSAAGCFEHLSNVVLPLLKLPAEYKDPCSPEFSKPSLQAFVNLFLAQAQECFWQKAVMGWWLYRLPRGC
jgi:programmed cell death 6-interacting protein